MSTSIHNPAVSQAQYLLAQAVLSGASDEMPVKVARELVDKTPARFRSLWSKERGNPLYTSADLAKIVPAYARVAHVKGHIYLRPKNNLKPLTSAQENSLEVFAQDYGFDYTRRDADENTIKPGFGFRLYRKEAKGNPAGERLYAVGNNQLNMEGQGLTQTEAVAMLKKHPQDDLGQWNFIWKSQGTIAGAPTWKKVSVRGKRGNPARAADSMHESFHGMPPNETIAYTDRLHVHSHLAGIGTLVGLKVRTVCGQNVALYFEKQPGGKKSNPRKGPNWLEGASSGAAYAKQTSHQQLSDDQLRKAADEEIVERKRKDKEYGIKPRIWPRYKLGFVAGYKNELTHKLWQDARAKSGNPSLSQYLAGHAASVSTSNFIPYRIVPTETDAYTLQGKLAKSGIGSRVDRIRTRLLPTPRYKYEVLVDRANFKAHAHSNPSLPKLIRSKSKGVFKPAVKFVGEVVDSIYTPGQTVMDKGAAALDRGLKLNPKAVSEMSAGEINKAMDKLEKQESDIVQRFIDTGRGHERPSEYLNRSTTDPLSLEAQSVWQRRMALRNEMERRYGPGTPSRLPKKFGPIKQFNKGKKSNPQFAGPAQLATNEKGTQLFIEGGDQSIDLASLKITGPESTKENVVVGEVWLISYFTTKVFDAEEESYEYVHGFGSEKDHVKLRKSDDLWKDAVPPEKLFGTGELPTLIYRPLEQRLMFAGGVYHIEKPLLETSPGIED